MAHSTSKTSAAQRRSWRRYVKPLNTLARELKNPAIYTWVFHENRYHDGEGFLFGKAGLALTPRSPSTQRHLLQGGSLVIHWPTFLRCAITTSPASTVSLQTWYCLEPVLRLFAPELCSLLGDPAKLTSKELERRDDLISSLTFNKLFIANVVNFVSCVYKDCGIRKKNSAIVKRITGSTLSWQGDTITVFNLDVLRAVKGSMARISNYTGNSVSSVCRYRVLFQLYSTGPFYGVKAEADQTLVIDFNKALSGHGDVAPYFAKLIRHADSVNMSRVHLAIKLKHRYLCAYRRIAQQLSEDVVSFDMQSILNNISATKPLKRRRVRNSARDTLPAIVHRAHTPILIPSGEVVTPVTDLRYVVLSQVVMAEWPSATKDNPPTALRRLGRSHAFRKYNRWYLSMYALTFPTKSDIAKVLAQVADAMGYATMSPEDFKLLAAQKARDNAVKRDKPLRHWNDYELDILKQNLTTDVGNRMRILKKLLPGRNEVAIQRKLLEVAESVYFLQGWEAYKALRILDRYTLARKRKLRAKYNKPRDH